MEVDAHECFPSAAAVCNYMPYELSYERHYDNVLSSEKWLFCSRQDNELQKMLCSSSPGFDASISRNLTIKEKIKPLVYRHMLHLSSTSLVQFWVPVKIAGRIYLTTADQPFSLSKLLKVLCSYRKLCLENLLIDVDVEHNLGPVGRVFRHRLPECCSDISYYLPVEYLQRDGALHLGIKVCMALPLIESIGRHCIGVLEIVSTKYFDDRLIIQSLYAQLETMGLTCNVHPSFDDERFVKANTALGGSEAACSAAFHVMENIFLKHELRLAHMWAARSYTRRIDRICQLYGDIYCGFECLNMWKAQGVVGKAFSSRGICFCKNVSNLSISVYPLVPLARKLQLSGCLAVCLKSAQDNCLYILEFFFYFDDEDEDPRTYVSKLIADMKRYMEEYRNSPIQKLDDKLVVEVLKISSDTDEPDSFEIGVTVFPHDSLQNQNSGSTEDSRNNTSAEPTDFLGSLELRNNQTGTAKQGKTPGEQPMGSGARGKCAINTLDIENQITRDVLEQHSAMKLQDVANLLGVGRSTLKRICRKHEIKRWPPMRSNRAKNSYMNQASTLPANENTDAHMTSNAMTVLDHSRIMIKAVHGEDLLKFQLSVSAKKMDLEQQIAKRLNPSVKSYKIKYLDEENEWVSVACDEDLKLCIDTFRSQGKTTIRMLVD